MEISYRRDGNQNFMIIKDIEIDENDYKIQMLKNNKISGIIPMNIESVNNKKEVYYDITSKISMINLYYGRQMSGKEIYNFIQDIKSLSDCLKEYLLDMGNVILDFEKIYFNRQSGKYEFCYLPNDKRELHENIRNMFNKMLEYIDHNDKEAVLIAYGIQQITVSDDFTISDIMNCAYENIQEYKKEREVEEQEFQAEKNLKSEIALINPQKETENKEGILSSLFHIFKKKNTYLNEDELKVAYVREENSGYSEETMLLSQVEMKQSVVLKSIGKEEVVIIPNKFPYIIGNSKRSCNFVVASPVVSRVHMRILEMSNEYFIEDLNSTNRTFVNGRPLIPHEPKKIQEGDRITLANIDFIVE